MALDISSVNVSSQQPTIRQPSRLAAVLLAIGSALFLFLLWAAHRHVAIDSSVLSWMAAHRTATLTTIMKTITNVAAPVTFTVAIMIVAGLWAWRSKELWRPALLISAMGLTLATSTLIKLIIQRGRPPVAVMVPPPELDYSFPSGHTIGTAVFILVVGYLLYSRRPTALNLTYWIAVAIAGTSLVALSRLYLGYHWLTDVSASVALALVILAIVIAVDTVMSRRASN